MTDDQESNKDQANRILAKVNVMIFEALHGVKVYSGDPNLGVAQTETSLSLTEKEGIR